MSDNITQADYEKRKAELAKASVGGAKTDDFATQEAKDRALQLLDKQFECAQENSKREGKGLRLKATSTRGKGSIVITFEEFDLEKPETNPESVKEFMDLASLEPGDAKSLLRYAMKGFNEEAQDIASDPVAEFINAAWSDADKLAFKLTVKNMAKMMNQPIETIANQVKPGLDAKYAK